MEKRTIHIVGVHQKLEAYPNVRFLLNELEKSEEFNYSNYNVPIWSGSLSSRTTAYTKAKKVFKGIYSHLNVLHFFFKTPDLDRVYIPYPAIFIAFALSFLAERRRPKFLVIDAFISIYDTAVIDRNLCSKRGLVATLLKKIEKKAFEQADVVITDTLQNSLYYSELFNLSLSKFRNIPLATDEVNFSLNTTSFFREVEEFNVVFIGTLIPLHGIETILSASKILLNNNAIKFTIIGDGQMSHLVENEIGNGASNIKWIRQWQSSKELASHLSKADIGLGVFGVGEKTQRVCPLKIYIYLACGLPVITGKTDWSIEASREIDYAPLMSVSVGNSEELAASILECSKSESLCTELSSNGRRYYDNKLANITARKQFERIFTF